MYGQSPSANAPGLSQNMATGGLAVSRIDWEDEEAWLRGVIIRLRTLLRLTQDERVEAGLKDIVGDAERRLEQLQHQQFDPFDEAPGG
jgi:hypothetical protein